MSAQTQTKNTPVRVKKARLWDHYSATSVIQIAEPQPQYGLVQLNSYRRGQLSVSHDVNRADFIKAVEAVLNVTVTENAQLTEAAA
ncbi:hypothetical protein [Arthrobacter sp. SLBN-83]|uniref:hypothetical protein n=1 Tax=Arthrobacter sp. SLBN-83 TaxID=2768449 RepID=UPI00114E0EB4|nr:hypothetical protein [Arthrobacter sp. SLBN-83]